MRIRLWKLGSLEHKIMPSPAAFAKLRSVLQEMAASPDQAAFDIIWDPSLTVEEIEVGPEGINVVSGPGDVSDELRDKIEKLIVEELAGETPAQGRLR